MRNINFEKIGLKFMFRNPVINHDGYFVFEYKIIGVKENEENEGYYYNAKFDIKNKAIKFGAPVKINGNECGGVKLFDEDFDLANTWYMEDSKAREDYINNIIRNLISGEKKIEWGIVGCDYPKYQAWITVDKSYNEQEIMEKAIKTLLKKNNIDSYVSNACNYMAEHFKPSIGTVEDMKEGTMNYQFDKKTQGYYGFKETIVTSFETTLSNAINLNKLKKKQIEHNKMNGEKASMNVEILNSSKSEDDLSVIVRITDIVTGENLKFSCRNIFDFGYVVNPYYEIVKGKIGGLENKGMWQTFEQEKGWYDIRELTEFEKRCVDYLNKFSPITTEIRM